MASYALVRVKRDWVPDFLWRALCIGNIVTWQPLEAIFTRKQEPVDE